MANDMIGITVTVDDKVALKKLENLRKIVNELNGTKITISTKGIDDAVRTAKTKAENGLKGTKITPKIDTGQINDQFSKVKGQIESKPIRVTMAVGKAGAAMLTIANSFTKVLDNSLTNITRNFGATITSMLTSSIFTGMGKVVERYDTFKLYSKQMQLMGADADEAEKSVQRLNDSVLGLPTPLNEIVKYQKQFYSMTGDVKEATDLAIAMNNAFLASGSSAKQQDQGYKQLVNMLSGGKLQKKQWISLTRSMPGAIREMGKSLGYTGKELDQYVQDVNAGEISTKDFLNTLKKTGTGKGSLVDIAGISKQSLSGIQANMQTAIASFGQKTLEALDDVLSKQTGRGLVSHLQDVVDTIKELGNRTADWIRNHPEVIMKFLDRLENFNWDGMIEGIKTAGKMYAGFIDILSRMPGGLLGFVIAGGGSAIMKGLYPVAGLFKAIGQFGDISAAKKTAKGMSEAAEAMSGMGRATSGMGKSAATVADNVAGDKIKRATAKIGEGAKNVGRFTAALGKMALAGAVVAEFVGVYYLAAKAISEVAKMNFPFEKIQKNTGNIILVIGELTGVFTALGMLMTSTPAGLFVAGSAGLGAGISLGLVGAFAAIAKLMQSIVDVKLPSFTKIKSIAKVMKTIRDEFSHINLGNDWLFPRSLIKGGVVTGYVASFTDIAKLLDSIKGINIKNSQGIENTAKSMKNVFKAISGAFDGDILAELAKRWNSSNQRKVFDNFKGIVEDISSVITTMKGLPDKVAQLKDTNYKKLSEKIRSALSGVGVITEGLKEEFGHYFGGTTGSNISEINLDAKDLESFKKLVDDVSGILTSVQTLIGGFKQFNDSFKMLKEAFKGKSFDEISGVIKGKLQNMATFLDAVFGEKTSIAKKLNGVSKATENLDLSNVTQAFTDLKKALGALKGLYEQMQSMAYLFNASGNENNPTPSYGTGSDKLDKLFDNIGVLVDHMKEIGGKVGNPEDLQKKMYAIRYAMAQIVYAMGNLQKLPVNKDITITDFTTPVKDAVDDLIAIQDKVPDPDGLRERMFAIRKAVASLWFAMNRIVTMPLPEEEGKVDEIVDTISKIISDVGTKLTEAPLMAENAALFKQAADDVALAFATLTTGESGSIQTFVNYLGQIPGALSKVNEAMKGRGTAWKNQIIEGFKGTASKIVAYIQALPEKIKNVTGFYGAGNTHGRQYKNGFNDALDGVETRVDEIAEDVTNLRTRTNGTSGGDSGPVQTSGFVAATGGQVGNNGILYRAGGGDVFQPRGTDTVPAMLTEGEYVMRKGATDYFGSKFMQKINHLDLGGALDSLSARMASKLAGGTTIHNHNNQKVVQYITTNNENWSFMRANRFIRA